MCRALALMSLDPPQGLTWAREANERGRRSGLPWVEGFAFTFEGLLHAITGDAAAAEQSLERALAIQERLGDHEGAGLSLGGLGQLAASRGEEQRAVELYQRSLRAFETLGDRAEEARILSETGWVHLQRGDAESARRDFLDAAGRYLDVASVRGVGLALVGLAATAARDGRPAIAATLAAAAEVYAAQDGIVNVYGDDGAGRDVVEAARAALGEAELHAANDAGRGLTIAGALDLARIPVS
jgi:tetratricopeptide (TPR) repeat protein